MKKTVTTFITLFFLVGCAYIRPSTEDKNKMVGVDYTITGKIEENQINGYIYGDNTVLEIADFPHGFSVVNEKGKFIPYERMGKYIRLNDFYDEFTVWLGENPVNFSANTQTKIFGNQNSQN